MWWCSIGFLSLIRVCNHLMDQTSFSSMYFGWYEKDRRLTQWQSLSTCGLEVLGLDQNFCKIKQGLRLSRNSNSLLLIPPSAGAFNTRYALISYHFGWYEVILVEFNSLDWHLRTNQIWEWPHGNLFHSPFLFLVKVGMSHVGFSAWCFYGHWEGTKIPKLVPP